MSAPVRGRASLRALADVTTEASLANRFRDRRFELFDRAVQELARDGRPVRILDSGGTAEFWRQRSWSRLPSVEVVAVNLVSDHTRTPGVVTHVGDATDLSSYSPGEFDVVFSNSTIEHLETIEQQQAFAAAVRRLAPRYWIQTPNFWFPFEPHFLTPGWHWLPVPARTRLLQRRRFGWRGPFPDPLQARRAVEEIRLMRAPELRTLFPGAQLMRERIGPLTKSFIIHKGLLDVRRARP